MTLTSVELIDILRTEASRIEKGGASQQNILSINEIVKEIKNLGIQASGLEQLDIIRESGSATTSTGIAAYFNRWADMLEKQLLAMLDLPVDINFSRKAA